MSIAVQHLSKSYGSFQAVQDVNFDVHTGQLVALLGPSGSGKSSILRMIAGLEVPDRGRIVLEGRDVTDFQARDRRVGFVSQQYSLFRHMTVKENIAFGLQVRRRPKNEIEGRVAELLDLVAMPDLGGRFPHQLSGGQRQRVALARALAPEPSVLLLDEPFGALDARVRDELRHWIKQLHEQTHVTTVFVTHDQKEAMDVAGEIFILNEGCLIQKGTPRDIFENPATSFVAEFIGPSNSWDGVVTKGNVVSWGSLILKAAEYSVGQRVRVFIRPHDIHLDLHSNGESIPIKKYSLSYKGEVVECSLDFGENRYLTAHVSQPEAASWVLTENQAVYAHVSRYHVFPINR